MGQRSFPEEASEVLLEQFELILDHHKLIDEIGFIHPSQFAELNENSSFSWSPPCNIWQILDESRGRDTTGLMCLQNEKTVFWYGNHKLAISMQVVPLLYNAARLAHMDARINYKRSINISKSKISLNTATYEAQFPETDILKHSRSLLILSPDFGSVWNSSKVGLRGARLEHRATTQWLRNGFPARTQMFAQFPKRLYSILNHSQGVERGIPQGIYSSNLENAGLFYAKLYSTFPLQCVELKYLLRTQVKFSLG